MGRTRCAGRGERWAPDTQHHPLQGQHPQADGCCWELLLLVLLLPLLPLPLLPPLPLHQHLEQHAARAAPTHCHPWRPPEGRYQLQSRQALPSRWQLLASPWQRGLTGPLQTVRGAGAAGLRGQAMGEQCKLDGQDNAGAPSAAGAGNGRAVQVGWAGQCWGAVCSGGRQWASSGSWVGRTMLGRRLQRGRAMGEQWKLGGQDNAGAPSAAGAGNGRAVQVGWAGQGWGAVCSGGGQGQRR